MKPACVASVSAAIGRGLTEAEQKGIEGRVTLQMKLLARADPESWSKLSGQDRVRAASAAAAQQLIGELAKAKQRVDLTIQAHARWENFLAAQTYTKAGQRLSAVSQMLDWMPGAKNNSPFSAASWVGAVQAEANRRLVDTWTATNPKFFGLFESRQGQTDLIRELWGQDTGNAAARKGAEAWKSVTDELRDRMNAAGGDVGKLNEWHYPQDHSQARLAAAGFGEWSSDIIGKLDRKQYINTDGSRMSDEQVGSILKAAYDAIITDGRSKREPGAVRGYGSLIADRNSAHRALFFKDAQSWMDYQSKYSERGLYNVLTGHISRIARDIALTERLGPNAEQTFRYFNEKAARDDNLEFPTAKNKIDRESAFNQAMFDFVAGRNQVVNQKVADRWQAVRNWMTATKLGGVAITALGDEAGMFATAMANGVPYGRTLIQEAKNLTGAHAAKVREATGLGLNSMIGGLNRFTTEDFGQGFSGKVANAVMHASGAEKMWDVRRQSMGTMLMSQIGRLVQKYHSFEDFKRAEGDRVLGRKGITEQAWQVWKLAETEDFGAGAHSVLTPKAISEIPDEKLRDLIASQGPAETGNVLEPGIINDPQVLRRNATSELLAHTIEEAGMGAMDTGPRQRAGMRFGTQKGTAAGELAQSVFLFKSFAYSMMTKHWSRMASLPGAGALKYGAALGIYGTLIGGIASQLRGLASGQEPQNMADPRFWMGATLRGGGLGFYGDFLYSELNGYDTSFVEGLGGPLVSSASQAYKLSLGALLKYGEGQRTDEGGNLIRAARDNVPFLNMWYTKAAADHLLWNSLMEASSPGYLDRMQQRQYADKRTTYYWKPEDKLPGAAPNFTREQLANPSAVKPFNKNLQQVAETIGID